MSQNYDSINLEVKDIKNINDITRNDLVLALRNGKVAGMYVNDTSNPAEAEKWILKISGSSGCDGYHPTLQLCVRSSLKYGYVPIINVNVG